MQMFGVGLIFEVSIKVHVYSPELRCQKSPQFA